MNKTIYKIYMFMYHKMRNQGVIKNLIFKIWYEIEFLRCRVKNTLKNA